MRHRRELLVAFRNGDRLDDAELERLGHDMQQLADLAGTYGDMFVLQAVYAGKVARECREFLVARYRAAGLSQGTLSTEGGTEDGAKDGAKESKGDAS